MMEEPLAMVKEVFENIKDIRIIDFGNVSYLDSQAIYHTVAHSFDENTPDTITIMNPIQTYACIGFFQELEKEIDVEFCNNNNIPVIRREIGGGAVLLDNNQIFFHFIFNKLKVTRDVAKIYSIFLEPVVNTYIKLGLNVCHRPINDLHIDGKKIGGTGAAEIGNSTVVVGSFMLDFNYELMPQILKVPSEKFRDKVYQNVKDYVTTIKKEFGIIGQTSPSREKIIETFLDEVSSYFNVELFSKNSLDDYEKEKLLEIRKLLLDENWLKRKGKFSSQKVKITTDINIFEGNYKSTGGLIRITATLLGKKLKEIDISGDFSLTPPEGLSQIENILTDLEVDYGNMHTRINEIYNKYKIQSPGVSPEDFVEALKITLNAG
jgi:lipoate---protein ligase